MGGLNIDLDALNKSIAARKQVVTDIFQDEFGRDPTEAEHAQYPIDSPIFGNDVYATPDIDKIKQSLFNDKTYQTTATTELSNRIKDQIGEIMGITDQAKIDKIVDKFDSLRLITEAPKAGTGIKEALRSVDDQVTTIKNMRDADITATYAVAYSKATGGDTEHLQENLDEYLESIDYSDVGYDSFLTDDRKELGTIEDAIGVSISEAIENDESIQEIVTAQKEAATAAEPFGQEEVTAQLQTARDTLSDELAASRGNRTEDLRAAFKTFTDTIPDDIAKVREIAEERLTQRLEKLPETFGEFGARLGLGVGQSGQLQQSLAEETATQQAETERQLQEFELGRKHEAAGIGLNLEQNIADFEARQTEQIAQTGYGIEQYGTQIGREDFQTQLAQQFQHAQTAQAQEYNTFLTQMGYQQNQMAQQQAFQNQLSHLYQQQGFQANQSELDRQLQERLFNRSAELAEQQRSRQSSLSKRTSIQSLIGGGLGAGLGAVFAAPTGGLSMGAGALLGYGLGSGNQGATLAGASMWPY